MRALCPDCGGKGCGAKNCVDGYLQVKFAEGDWYTCQCLNLEDCGFSNGCNISKTVPKEPSERCVVCHGPTEWVLLEDIPEGANKGYEKNYDKFAQQSSERMIERLRSRNKELRDLAVSWVNNEINKDRLPLVLSLEVCKLLDICSVCYQPSSAVFVYAPWAHEQCLDEKIKQRVNSVRRVYENKE